MLRLAASYWTTIKERDRVLPLLRRAAHRLPAISVVSLFRGDLPEFQDVADDPEFRHAVAVDQADDVKV